MNSYSKIGLEQKKILKGKKIYSKGEKAFLPTTYMQEK